MQRICMALLHVWLNFFLILKRATINCVCSLALARALTHAPYAQAATRRKMEVRLKDANVRLARVQRQVGLCCSA